MSSFWRSVFGLLLAGSLCTSARAEVRLPSIFSDHMVLQRVEAAPVWGKADPGERVRVSLDALSAETKADASGRFRVDLNLKQIGPGPFEMTIEGSNRILIHDVVIGQVWLASGQSNMEHPLRGTLDAEREIAGSANPMLRQFSVKRAGANQPADNCTGVWLVAGLATSADFSAVGYYFGKELQQAHQAPVGIIHASHGGTFIEPWTPADVFDRVPSFKASADAMRARATAYPAERAKFAADYAAWLKKTGREDSPRPAPATFADPAASTADWQTITLATKSAPAGLPPCGVFWIRRRIDVSALVAAQGFKIMIGPLAGGWEVYWNGDKIDEMPFGKLPGNGFACYFVVPREKIKTGSNTLAIRIFSPASPLFVSGNSLWAGPIDLNGRWLAKVERALPELTADERATLPQRSFAPPPMLPAALFNAMIHPNIPYAISGVIWFQGESNSGRAFEYRTAFPTLIQGWREKWKRDDLPFYFCQVCNNFGKLRDPGESAWAELRESQSQALALPNTGQAVTIDLGEAGDLHFRDKKTVGHRLFLIAEANCYGNAVPFSGPTYKSISIEGTRARLRFDHADGGLVAAKLPARFNIKSLTNESAPLVRNTPDSELEGFAICGDDHKWIWAEAKIDGDAAIVWSDRVAQPVAVRYGWADNPTCNLYNGAGLPASPFRTDQFKVTTEGKHF